jgi:hypothetical protein
VDSSDPDYDPIKDPDYNWDDPEITEAKLEALKMERAVMDIDYTQQVKDMLTQAAPGAALGIISMANSATNENIKFNAQKYIVDRLLDPDAEAGAGLLESLLGDLVKDAEALANGKKI